jgi:hypothetical protein
MNPASAPYCYPGDFAIEVLPHAALGVGVLRFVADLEGRLALDTRALHLAMARRIVHDRGIVRTVGFSKA